MSQQKNWCFTLNNYTLEDIQKFKDFIQDECVFGIFQREVGECGTPHLQGYLQLITKKRISYLKSNAHGTAHFEGAKGSSAQNIAYCSKEGGSDKFELGTPVCERQRTDLSVVVAAVVEKRPLNEVASEFPEQWVKFYRGLESLSSRIASRRDFKTEVYWYYGPTGTGKSREAYRLAPDAYFKMGANKWWDGYDGQDTVIVDDYRRDLCTFAELLRLFDRYPHRVECKGGSREFLSTRIFITTPKSPADTWEGRSEEDIEQLLRRITEVKSFIDFFPAPLTPDLT